MMKKLLSLFLALVIALSAVGICYATAEADDKNIEIPGEEVTGSPTVDTAVYEEETIFIDEEPIPEGTPETSVETVDVGEETIPGDSSLPAAGGIPAEVFYAAGGLFIAVALVLTFTRKKAASKS